MPQKLIVANWKCNPDSPDRAAALAKKIEAAARKFKNVEAVIAPPFPFLPIVTSSLSQAALGAQNVFWENCGPYTGEVAARQLRRLRVKYVIAGHSERRRLLGETDGMVNKKVRAALNAGLKTILCVGEPREVRKKGLAAAKRFVERQLLADVRDVRNRKLGIGNLVVVYEPVWAISGGDPRHAADNPKNITEMVKFLKSILLAACPPRGETVRGRLSRIPVLYGGSVNAKNAISFFHEPEISGALVGGASLKPQEFAKILAAADRCARIIRNQRS